jgi:hypothetical protein
MSFPLSFWDISLLLGLASIILLITSELLFPYYGKTNLKINRRKLRNAAITFSALFLGTVVVKMVDILLNT